MNTVGTSLDSTLTINGDDTLRILATNTTGNTYDDVDNPTSITNRPAAGLVIDSLRGATHILGADGREVAITDVGGGINSASTIPVVNADGDAFVDSPIVQTTFGANNDDDVLMIGTSSKECDVTIHGNLNILGAGTHTTIHSQDTSVVDRYFEINHPASNNQAYTDDQTGGLIIVQTGTAGTPGTSDTGAGIRFNPTDDRFEFNVNITDLSTAATIDSATGWTGFGTLTGINAGAGIAISTTGGTPAATVAAPRLDLALTTSAAGVGETSPGAGDAVNPTGGLAFSPTPGTDASTVGLAQSGIYEQFLATSGAAGTAGQFLSLADAETGEFQWASPAGNVRKITHALTAAGRNGQNFYEIDTTTANSQVSGTDLGINLNVQVYETITIADPAQADPGDGSTDISVSSQIIPETIHVTATAVFIGVPTGIIGTVVITG